MERVDAARCWVKEVARTSNAMDLPPGLFKRSPRGIARGLKRSALASPRTKGTKFQSAMSMLNFFINRGGRGLTPESRRRLESAKNELRREFGRPSRREASAGEEIMPERRTTRNARRSKRRGHGPSTQAGEYVREEIHHVRSGKHGARSTKQAIAIGLSKARRAGVKVPRRGQGGRPSGRRGE